MGNTPPWWWKVGYTTQEVEAQIAAKRLKSASGTAKTTLSTNLAYNRVFMSPTWKTTFTPGSSEAPKAGGTPGIRISGKTYRGR